jgi:hypothetical protein
MLTGVGASALGTQTVAVGTDVDVMTSTIGVKVGVAAPEESAGGTTLGVSVIVPAEDVSDEADEADFPKGILQLMINPQMARTENRIRLFFILFSSG